MDSSEASNILKAKLSERVKKINRQGKKYDGKCAKYVK